MGETLTEMSLDDNASYVLTEDIFDAAMNQQFSYQDDIESEELSQGEETMITVINPDDATQSSSESTEQTAPTEDSAVQVQCESPSTSVLVIETGLTAKNLNGTNLSVAGISSIDGNDEINSVQRSPQRCSTISNNSETTWHNSITNNGTEVLETNRNVHTESGRKQETILARMLKETPSNVNISSTVEEETSEDESMDQDVVDNELQSVMESNLMAEVGININNIQKRLSPSTVSFKSPKISVKSISQISTSDFDSMPETLVDLEGGQNNSSPLTSGANKIIKVPKDINDQKSMSLHLNEIAVPNDLETFVNKQGEKMRCVYLKANERPILPRDKILLPPAGSYVDLNTQQTSKNITLAIPTMNAPTARKPIVISAPNMVSNSVMMQPNLYQSHKLIPIIPNQTVAAKSNFQVVSTIQKVRFENPKPSICVNSSQSRQKVPSVTENEREIYLPDVLLAPEPVKKKSNSFEKERPRLINTPKPNVLYESTYVGNSSVKSFTPETTRYQTAHRLTTIQKPVQSNSSQLNKNFASNTYLIPKLQKSPHANIIKPPAQDMGTQTVYQYQHAGMDSIIKSLLFHNLKKPYVPPEPHPCMDKITYNCPDCSDRFIFEKNLGEHLARKTLVIRYMCKMCGSEILFYNRCLLFKHLRMHNNSIKDLDFSCVKIGELPRELIDKGIASTTFKGSINPISLQKHERVLKNSKYGQWQATDVEKRAYSPIMSLDKIANQQVSLPTVSQVTPYVRTNTTTSLSIDKISNQQVSLPTVSQVTPYIRNNNTISPTPATPVRQLTKVVTPTPITTFVPVHGTPTPITTLVPVLGMTTPITTFVPVQGTSTPTFTPIVTSPPLTSPVIASSISSFTSFAHPTYSYRVPTTTADSLGASTNTAYSPYIQKMPHQSANQLKSKPSNSLLINNKSHSQNSQASNKIIFLSKVHQPKSHVVRPVQSQVQKSISQVSFTDKVEQESRSSTQPIIVDHSSTVDQINSTHVTQPIIVDHRVKYANKSTRKSKESVKDDTIIVIDNDEDELNPTMEGELADVESVWVENGNDSVSANSRKSSKSSSSKTHKRICPECGVSCLNIGKHLNGTGRPSGHPAMECQTCHLVLPTRCALKIHHRIHTLSPPYKCPDCGKDFVAWKEFHSHLIYSCGHLAKCVRFMCLCCKAHFQTRDSLGNHMKETHSRDVFKCQFCPVAFYSADALQKHTPEKHPNEECVLQTHHKQCSICTKKVVPVEKFNDHMEHHVNSSNNMVYAYTCPMCSAIFVNKMAFVIHQVKEKAKSVNKLKKKNSSSRLPIENHQVIDVEDADPEAAESMNLREADEPTIDTTFDESDDVVEKDPLSLDDWEGQKIKKEQEERCIICKKTYLAPNSKSSCCANCVSHVSSPISTSDYTKSLGLNPLTTPEKPCPKSKKRSMSNEEIDFESKVPKNIHNMSRNSSTSSENEAGNFALYQDVPIVKKKNRRKPNKQVKSVIEGQIMSSTAPAKLVCAKCKNFSGNTKEEFLAHIKSHRTEPNSYQCLECGLCFVVLPSLERHLQIYHQIRDVTSYVRENSACVPQKSSYMEERMDLEENQCPVCAEKFETKLTFEKHFRGHGRAFMSRFIK